MELLKLVAYILPFSSTRCANFAIYIYSTATTDTEPRLKFAPNCASSLPNLFAHHPGNHHLTYSGSPSAVHVTDVTFEVDIGPGGVANVLRS
jgi:hypothetical protein